ncbi:alkaline phosphatase [Arenicella chitinivorans]|uniref:Alkaline phosphatase n=1 Tax=Arenicella chitinivorans TaxID=1329800 RepID=A0A918S3E6_9GAMM|nr:alkaline phosphatase D family protein [Arenicella chitinivorans]GHA20842.1 alkaline phosphatase [Arenicella chitinivorans]
MHRRTVLTAIASAVLAACGHRTPHLPATNTELDGISNSTIFQHGVASGDPDQTSVVIWTRVKVNAPASVRWEVSLSPTFAQLVASGSTVASVDTDYTVKAVPKKLQPGQRYYYRFMVKGVTSPIGRTRTLPTGNVEQYGIALVSCSNFAFGYFNAYDAIANDANVDLVLHTGDYIYEYGADGWGADIARKLDRVHSPAHETVSLSDYRTRHAQYKTDHGSQAMHAAHPMICCWDDHESANNPWLNGAQNHQADSEGDWSDRRAAAVQAYYEWMPVRDPIDAQKRLAFSRRYNIGNLATIVTLESRHTARTQQIDYLDYVNDIQSQADADVFKANVVADPQREMVSPATQKLLVDAFAQSRQQHQPWRLIGNASPIARMLVPDVAASGITDNEPAAQLESNAAKALFWKGKYHLPFYTDTWDGYPAARERLYAQCRAHGIQDMVFLTGDSHSFWLNQLADERGNAMGIEIGTAGVSSPGDFVESGWSLPVAAQLDRLFESELDEVIWTDNLHQGYVRVDLTSEKLINHYIAVNTVLSETYTAKTIKQATITTTQGQLTVAH